MERVTRPGEKRDADGAESECKDAFEPRKADPCGRADVVKADSSSRASTTDTARISPSASGTSVEVERPAEPEPRGAQLAAPAARDPAPDVPSPSLSPEKPSRDSATFMATSQSKSLEDDVAICKEWIELVAKRPFKLPFEEELKSGEILCEVALAISSTSVRRYNKDPKTPFKRLENLSTFIQACRSFGVMEYELFSTSDVVEGKGTHAVTRCLFALGRAIQTTCPGFAGPHLGNADNSKRKPLPRTQSGSLLGSPVPHVPSQWNGATRVQVDGHSLDRGKWALAAARTKE
jgi:hypothetical protein